VSFQKAERLDAVGVREKDGKSYWFNLGVAFPAKQGPGWTLYLNAVPAPTDGQYKIMLMEPKPKTSQAGPDGRPSNEYDQSVDDTSIPF
jgi:hypothetical protein